MYRVQTVRFETDGVVAGEEEDVLRIIEPEAGEEESVDDPDVEEEDSAAKEKNDEEMAE